MFCSWSGNKKEITFHSLDLGAFTPKGPFALLLLLLFSGTPPVICMLWHMVCTTFTCGVLRCMLRERNIGSAVDGRRRGYCGKQWAVSQALKKQRGLGNVPRVSRAQIAAAQKAVEAKEGESETGIYSYNSCIRGYTSFPVIFYLPWVFTRKTISCCWSQTWLIESYLGSFLEHKVEADPPQSSARSCHSPPDVPFPTIRTCGPCLHGISFREFLTAWIDSTAE